MGDVYRLVNDQLVEDTPADRRKIDLTAPLAKVSLSTYLLISFSYGTPCLSFVRVPGPVFSSPVACLDPGRLRMVSRPEARRKANARGREGGQGKE